MEKTTGIIKLNTLYNKANNIKKKISAMRLLLTDDKLAMHQIDRDLLTEVENLKAMVEEQDETFWTENAQVSNKKLGDKALVVSRTKFKPFKED